MGRTIFVPVLVWSLLPVAAWCQWTGGPSGPIYYNGGNVGIGSSVPAGRLSIGPGPFWGYGDLQVMSDISGYGYIARSTGSSTQGAFVANNASAWGVMTTRGTQGARATLSNGDALGEFFYGGGNGTSYVYAARIAAFVNGTPSGGIMPADLSFAVQDSGGSVTERMRIAAGGNVGIGTSAPQYKLAVNGTIGTKEVVVSASGWADYVFRPGYRLRGLDEVAAHIRKHGRLPGMPSEKEVQEKGVGLAEMQVKLLAKVEELTLHLIASEQRNRKLEERVASLEAAAEGGAVEKD